MADKRADRAREIRAEYLATGCKDCGLDEPLILHFHHRNPAEKLYAVASMLHYSETVIRAEIAKCDVLCPNCHARRHILLDNLI